MSIHHNVKQGDCLASIAHLYGFADYKVIYDHPENSEFRKARPNPNLIMPGDQIFIPDRELKSLSVDTDKRHRFVVNRSKTVLRVVIRNEDGEPCDSVPYQILLGGVIESGVTDANGLINHHVPADLKEATLDVWVGTGDCECIPQRWILKIGYLDPVEYSSGIQGRLNNLGFDCGKVDGIIGPKTKAAIKRFQEQHGLIVDGIAGPKTQAKLKTEHGC